MIRKQPPKPPIKPLPKVPGEVSKRPGSSTPNTKAASRGARPPASEMANRKKTKPIAMAKASVSSSDRGKANQAGMKKPTGGSGGSFNLYQSKSNSAGSRTAGMKKPIKKQP